MGDSSEDGCKVRTGLCFICCCKMKKFYMGKDCVLLSYGNVSDGYYFNFQWLSHKVLLVSFAVGCTASGS